MFLVIEGPNGVGKTAVAQSTVAGLRRRFPASPIVGTREPSGTALGQAIRLLEGSMPPRSLALSCAADRLDHVAREIEPALEGGAIVVCDRYVPSSLVLQRLDGLGLEELWALNKEARSPDATVYLEADPATIQKRLTERGRRSRFELSVGPEVELALYKEARDFLSLQGWRHYVVGSQGRTADEVAADVIRLAFE